MAEAVLANEYRSFTHDPLMLRTVMLLKESGYRDTHVARTCGVSTNTLRNWRDRKTKRPQAATLRFVLRAMGYELTIKKS